MMTMMLLLLGASCLSRFSYKILATKNCEKKKCEQMRMEAFVAEKETANVLKMTMDWVQMFLMETFVAIF